MGTQSKWELALLLFYYYYSHQNKKSFREKEIFEPKSQWMMKTLEKIESIQVLWAE